MRQGLLGHTSSKTTEVYTHVTRNSIRKIISLFKKHLGTKFSFLGFDFRWKVSRNGKDYILMETTPKRMTKSLKAFNNWCKENIF